ncbi:MAG: glycosyltransferase family 39 protein [Sphingomicrobium sp.]
MDAAAASRAPIGAFRVDWRVTPLRLAALLTLAAIGVRLIGIGMRPLWLDEAYSAWFSARGWHELWTVVPTYETHPPFYYSLLKLWRMGFGGSEVSLRFPSILFGAASVPIAMLAARELERLRPSGRPMLLMGIAGFLAACGPTLIEHGQEARPYALMAFSYAIATFGLLRLLREFADGEAGSRGSWMIFATAAELTLWSHALGAIYAAYLALALLPAWLTDASRQRIARGLAAAAAIALLYLPCLWIIVGRTGDWGSGWLRWNPEMLLKLISIYGVPVEVLTIGSAVAALILLLSVKRAIAAGFTERGWGADRALLLLWWGPPIATALISAVYMPVFLARTLTPTLIPCYLAVSAALARIASPRERMVLTAGLIVTLVPSSVAMALRPATEQWDQVDAFLNENVRPGDVVWVYPNDNALPLRAAGPRSAYARRGIPADYPAIGVKGPIRSGSPAVVSLTRDSANALAQRPDVQRIPTIWLLESQPIFADPHADVPHALERYRRAGAIRHWGYITVQPFTRR